MKLPLTGSQTVGPYFSIGLEPLCSNVVPSAGGSPLRIEGKLLDGAGAPIPDGFLEIWQADAHGKYAIDRSSSSPQEALGFGRIKTSADGSFSFTTTRPGPVPYDATQMQAPHLVVLIFMRGVLRNLVTRMYFPNEPANLNDPVLQLVPAKRRHTLIAQLGDQTGTLRWNILMRGYEAAQQEETVFFAW